MNTKKRKFSHQNQNKTNEDFTLLSLLKSCGISLLIFLAISAVSVLIFALVFYKTEDPTSHIHLASMISLYFAAFLSAFIMSKRNGSKHLIGGFMLGLFIIVLSLAISLLFKGEPIKNSVMLRSFILIATILGAILGDCRKEPRHKKHKFS